MVAVAVWWLRAEHGPVHYTGFVEGEERVIRSEVDRARARGAVPARAIRCPPAPSSRGSTTATSPRRSRPSAPRWTSFDAEIRRQEEQITLTESHVEAGSQRAARPSSRRRRSAAELAERTFAREQDLVQTGASTAQLLDDMRARARPGRERARPRRATCSAAPQAEERSITLARQRSSTCSRSSATARGAARRAGGARAPSTRSTRPTCRPSCRRSSSGRASWRSRAPRSLSVLDPRDKYVQVYVPVADVDRFRVGQRVEIELDSQPGHRVPGEVSFVADSANFTPEKIETRSDRLGPGLSRQGPHPRRTSSASSPAPRATSTWSTTGPLGAMATPERPPSGSAVSQALRRAGGARRHRPRARRRADRRRRRTRRRRQDDAAARARRAARDRGRRGARPRPRPARRRDRAQGAHRLRAAGLQPAPRSLGDGEPALHGAPASPAGRRVRRRARPSCSSAPASRRSPTGPRARSPAA